MENKHYVKITRDTVANCKVVYAGEIHEVSEKEKKVLLQVGKAIEATKEDKEALVAEYVKAPGITQVAKNDEVIKKIVKRGK